MHLALKTLGVGEGDEVIVQAYTCIVVINAITALGGVPVYADVQNDFNAEAKEIRKKITKKTKAIIVQYTFGAPLDIEEIIKLAKQKNIKLVEDCAHALGTKIHGQKVGTFGDIGMFSFGSDKVISSIRGGALCTNDNEIAKKLKVINKSLPELPKIKIWQHLNSAIIFPPSRFFYELLVGKIILWGSKKLNLTNKIIYSTEKQGQQPKWMLAKYPNVLAHLLYQQLLQIDKRNNHRRKIAGIYNKKLSNAYVVKPNYDPDHLFLRYTVLTPKPCKLHNFAKSHGIILGDWYCQPIAPKDINQECTNYCSRECRNAERLASMSVNLPTNINISIKKAFKIVNVINKYES